MACSSFWKFDKIDKIGISLILILSCFFSIFDCFCYASEITEQIEVSTVDEITLSYNGVVISTSDINADYVSFYFPVSSGVTYDVVLSDFRDYRSGFVKSLTVGEDVLDFQGSSSSVPSSISFVSDYDGYFFVVSSQYSSSYYPSVSAARTYNPTGYSDIISFLVDNVGLLSLWNIFETSVPYVLLVVVFSFGVYLITRMTKGLSRGKGRI